MNIDLKQEQLAARGKARTFAVEYISPAAERNDREEIFPREILNSLAPTGLMTPTLPLEWGGSGLDFNGEPLSWHHLLQEILADMAVQVEAARLLVFQPGHLKNKGR